MPIADRSEPAELAVGQSFNPYRLFTGIFIPEALVRWDQISPGAKLCYGRLARYAGKTGRCFPSTKTLAAELGITKDQARRYLYELRDVGLIRLENRWTKDGDRDTNLIIFLWHNVLDSKNHDEGGVNSHHVVADMPLRVVADMPPPLEESHSEESQDLDSDLDLDMTTSQKTRSGRVVVSLSEKPKAKPKQYPDLRLIMAQYMNGGSATEPTVWPSDRQVLDTLEAAGGVPESEVIECLRRMFTKRGLTPGTSTGPESWAWFPAVVYEQFETQRAREIRAREFHPRL